MVIQLVLLVAVFPSFAYSQSDLLAEHNYAISLAELVDEDGVLSLPQGFSGTIDPSGFALVSKPDQPPRFVIDSMVDLGWSRGEFGIPGCNGTIFSVVAIGNELFIGGRFDACGFILAANIVRFDTVTGEI
ncbi:MAG: hypothetical protein AAGH65_09805, partial [Pseudomonadota bacterium]